MNAYYVMLKFAKLWELQAGTRLHHEDTKSTKKTE